METLTLSDGRTLAYDTFGDPDGTPVIFNHGLSDSRLIRNPDEALTASQGVRMIAADQPGVGGSSPQPNRQMVDWGSDMEELANHLKLDSFTVAGHSGGGPTPFASPSGCLIESPEECWLHQRVRSIGTATARCWQ